MSWKRERREMDEWREREREGEGGERERERWMNRESGCNEIKTSEL